MKKHAMILLFSLFFFVFLSSPILAADQEFSRYIISYHDPKAIDLIKSYGGKIEETYEFINAIAVKLEKNAAAELANSHLIEAIKQDSIVSTSKQETNWGFVKIRVPRASQQNITGKGVKVAILDSGVDVDHEDLRIKKGISFVDYTESFNDDNGHGTHVAGIVAAQNNQVGVVGVAPDVELYVAKVLDQNGDGYESDVIKAIEWAIKEKVDIINISMGGSEYIKAFEDILQVAYDQGILLVAAAGNSGSSVGLLNTVDYPAKYDTVIAVAATNQNDEKASFSATGSEVEVAAPGVNILSTFIDNKYSTQSGTSMAAPFVVGHLALLKEANPELTNEELRELLHTQTIDLGAPGRDMRFGYGRIEIPSELKASPDSDEPPFSDLNGTEWYAEPIKRLKEAHILVGYEDGTVRAAEPITRTEATILLLRALKINAVPYKNYFTDVNSNFYAANDIQAALENKLIAGYADGSFRPNAFITRGEAAALFVRGFHIELTQRENIFPDVNRSYFAYREINALADKKLASGFPDGTYKPNATITRAEFAAFLDRLLAQ